MKKTFWVDTFRNIRKRIVSWFSIAIIIFIGITGILGVHSAAYSMESKAAAFYAAHNFMDYAITSNLGIIESEVEKIRNLDYISDAEGIIRIPGQIYLEEVPSDVTIISQTKRISVPLPMEGELPSGDDEVAIDPDLAHKMGINIGDIVWIEPSASRLSGILKRQEFKVTGFLYNPNDILKASTYYCLLDDDAFDTSKLSFDYTEVILLGDIPVSQRNMKAAYFDEVKSHVSEMEDLTDELADERKKTFSSELDEEYSNKEKEAQDKLAEAASQLEDAKKEFNDKIGEGSSKLEEGKTTLAEGKTKAETELHKALKQIQDGEAQYNQKVADGQKQLEDAKAQLEKELSDKKFLLFDGFLTIDKNEKLLNEKEAEYSAGITKLLEYQEMLKVAKEIIDSGREEYREALDKVGEKLGDEALCLDEIIELLEAAGQSELAEMVRGIKSISLYDRAVTFLEYYNKYGEIKEAVDKVVPDAAELVDGISLLKKGKEELENYEAEYSKKEAELREGKEFLEESRKKLDEAWFSLNQAKQKLADGQNELAKKEPEARAELASKEAEFEQQKAEGAKKLQEARAAYNTNKDKVAKELADKEKELEDAIKEFETRKKDGENQLSEAQTKYDDSVKEVEEALADAKEEIEKAKAMGSRWTVQTREANVGFMHFKSVYEVLANFFMILAPLYVIVVALVVFFTMTIVVEEQTIEIGVSKAFGMYVKEVMQKYMTFGVTAAIMGVFLGFIGSYGLQYLFLYSLRNEYIFGEFSLGLAVVPAVILALGSVILVAFVVVRACRKLLSCSAVGLINGTEPVRKTIKKAGKTTGKRSLYFSLILNNIVTDIGRVIVSVIIIMFSCLLIGLGYTAQNGLLAALGAQLTDVWHYDLAVVKFDDTTDEDEERIREYMKDCRYSEIYSFVALMELDNNQVPVKVLVADDASEFEGLYSFRDKNGPVTLTDDAMLVTAEMVEKDHFNKGTEVKIITPTLDIAMAQAGDSFIQYFEKTAIMTTRYYEKIMGEKPEDNTYLVMLQDGMDLHQYVDEFWNIQGIASITISYLLRDRYDAVLTLFNYIVLVVIVLAVLLSLMILLNLSNILVLHRMRELLTMRVNGFSNGQVIGYLARETIATLVAGLTLGIALGVPFSSFVVKKLEPAAIMLFREPYPYAWYQAVLITTLFSLVINTIAFRKVGKVPLTDITRY